MIEMIERLRFTEADHTYTYDDKPVISVTQVLAPLSNFSMIKPEVLNAASAFGTAVHLACELHDAKTLNESDLDAALVPYLQGWKDFNKDYECDWHMNEERVFHPTHRYAGTLDRYGIVKGKLAVVDIKSSVALYPSVGPQLAAYKNAIPNAPPVVKRLAVQLKPDGTYVVKEYSDASDWPMFLSLLTVRNWCVKHSITPNFKG